MESPGRQTAAWWVWVGGQAAIVALYAFQVKLSGGYPEPVEATADLGLATGQLLLGTLLAPVLLPTVRSMLMAFAPALVFSALAGQLSGQSLSNTAVVMAVMFLWLAVAGVWSYSPTARLALLFLTVGVPMLFYVSLEYGSAPTSPHNWPWVASPVLGVCSTRLHGTPWRTLPVGLAMLASGLGIRGGLKTAETLYCNVPKSDE